MDADLFEVFDEPAKRSKSHKRDKKRGNKRSLNGDVKLINGSAPALDVEMEIEDTSSGRLLHNDQSGEASGSERDAKRPKRAVPAEDPVVADTFETEQAREVTASGGLQGSQADAPAVVLHHQVRHQVSLPPNFDYVPISQHKPPEKPAREYPFKLDPFQQVSVHSIQRNESVLVSAHTSAGKTVVAEYAIAQCLQNNQRVIYTSPIKALSNQKYREFNAEFGDVGLMTGDVTINPTATCLVMTTEILRSMLYRGSEIMREVAWVVFDEVHYLRDPQRGVVWEETIILLPDSVRYVFLSATIPNAMQFAEWITKTHNQPCHVVYTDFRPTPLQHYLFPAGADGIHLVVDEKGAFREDNFQKAMSAIAERQGTASNDPNAKFKGSKRKLEVNKGGQKGSSDIYKIVKMIMLKNYNPVIVFSFSKRECEDYALQMAQLSFNEDNEKALVTKVFNSAIENLSLEDRELPQVQHILPLLKRGIGVHHSGLLPLLKEVIEILFQEGLIKVLFATETFSIGLNMPAKTVVFTSVRKFDGKQQRWVTPSEFIQMSGRAGRRGLDERGIVIMMIDEQMEPAVAKEIVRGQQDKLNSAFYLGYNMILNLMRVEGISPEYMLERCFYQFQNTAGISNLEKELFELENERSAMVIEDEATIKEYYDLKKQIDQNAADMRLVIQHPNHCLQFLQPGRVVHIKSGDTDFGWGPIVDYMERRPGRGQKKEDISPQESYTVDVVIPIASDTRAGFTGSSADLLPPPPGDRGRMEVLTFSLSCIQNIGQIRVNFPKGVATEDARKEIAASMDQVHKHFRDGIAILDPVDDMRITDDSFKKIIRKIEILESRFLTNALINSPRLHALNEKYSAKVQLTNRIKEVRKEIAKANEVRQLDELKNRKRVLRRLGFVNDADVVQLKARVACEISTGDELVLSELLFNGYFNDLTPAECAAVLSCFVFEEKTKESPQTRERLLYLHHQIVQQARNIATFSLESKLALDEDAYVKSFQSELMEVVYRWSEGGSFAEICKMTDVYEGSLIRVFRRLEELMRQMAVAGKAMGNETLEAKFGEALKLVRRDLVAAQSLYL